MRTSYWLLPVASFGLLVGCGGGSGLPAITPNISIESPTNNSTVNLSANKQIAINFKTNYDLKAKGMCAGTTYCGHVYVLVDSSSCNLPDLPYNSLAVSSPGEADLSKCTMPTGSHTITLELHNDDGSTVRTLVGSPVTSVVTITAQ